MIVLIFKNTLNFILASIIGYAKSPLFFLFSLISFLVLINLNNLFQLIHIHFLKSA